MRICELETVNTLHNYVQHFGLFIFQLIPNPKAFFMAIYAFLTRLILHFEYLRNE